jgi:D-serine deaminase-like pyridoxal phosphate-dependent protein
MQRRAFDFVRMPSRTNARRSRRRNWRAAPSELRFELSLYVLASVMSVPAAERAIVDAGLKAFSFDSGLPLVHGRAGAEYVKASDEHGVLRVRADAPPVAQGERVWLIPGHCDPTVNLYDWIVAVRSGVVEGVWPIEARGALG